MRLHFVKCLVIGMMAVVPIGCEPRADDGTNDTIFVDREEERQIERDADHDVTQQQQFDQDATQPPPQQPPAEQPPAEQPAQDY